MKNILKKIPLILLSLIFLTSPAYAQTDIYQQLQAPFYDPGSDGTSSDSCSASGSGNGILPSDITNAINRLKPDYQKASQATNVPWELLAAVHYRETNFSTTSSNMFQIGGYSGPSDVTTQAIAAGNFTQKYAVPGNLPNHRAPLKQSGNDPEEIKDTLYSYNGRAAAYAQQAQTLGFNPQTQPYEGSPYVMNNYDAIHKNMGIITHDGGGIDGTDTRYGAFVIYDGIGGSSGSTSDCSGAVSGNLIQTILNYAWPDYHHAPYCPEKDAYKAAIQSAANSGQYVGGTCTIGGTWVGVDCGAFVTRLMIDSGTYTGYNYGGKLSAGAGNTIQQQQYLDQQVAAGKYIKLSNVNGTPDLRPGDIAINTVHTYIFVGHVEGFNGNSASASFSSTGESWRAPMASPAYGFGGEFTWYRLKAGI
jgi:hypothetical protein